MKQSIAVLPLLLAARSFAGDPCSVVINTGSIEINTDGVACSSDSISTENFFAKSYDLSTLYPGQTLSLSCVAFGVENSGTDIAGSIVVYTDTDGGAPQGPGIDLVSLGQADFTVANTPGRVEEICFDPPLALPADGVYVVELFFTASADGFAAFGGNFGPDSTPTYIRSAACGSSTYASLASLGFSNLFWAQSLIATGSDCDGNGVEDCSEIESGTATDCDGNGRPDVCDVGVVAAASLDGIPTSKNRLIFETADLALTDPLADAVTVTLEGHGEFDASAEFLTVLFDGSFLGFAFNGDGQDCTTQVVTFEIARAAWEAAAADGTRAFDVYASPAVNPAACPASQVSISVAYLGVPIDCNANGLWDGCDIGGGDSTDFDGDGVPDDCQPDCDADGRPDAWAISEGLVPDCNGNGEPDSCDISNGVSNDVDTNGVPDECKPDCNGNGLPDAYEIATGLEQDCNTNGRPDSCDIEELGEPDCDGDGAIDLCAIADGAVPDCNGNEIPDSCDITNGLSNDVDGDAVPDECQPDCNGNGLPDAYELAEGLAGDCNGNGLPDTCDIAAGDEPDDNANGVPDGCDLARGDLDLDGCVGPADLGFMLALWGIPNPPVGDLDGDGVIGASDLGILLANWDC